MAIFIYQAKNKVGDLKQGQIEAKSKDDAFAKIDSLNLFPITIEVNQVDTKIPTKVSLKELVDFTSQLSSLINSGSTLLASLKTLSVEMKQLKLNPVIIDIIEQIEDGKRFSEVLSKYPKIFSKLYVSLVMIGETSGTLGLNLRRIAEFLDERLEFKKNIVSIMTYPVMIMFVALATILILFNFVIPKLSTIFDAIGQSMPWPTVVVLNTANFMQTYWYVIIALIVSVIYLVVLSFKNDKNRLKFDRNILSAPILGNLLKKVELSQLARTFSVLLSNGVPIDSALTVLSNTIMNRFFQKEVVSLEDQIKQGSSLNEAMSKTKVFPPSFINIVTVGEVSGNLSEVLDKVSKDYSKDIDRSMKQFLNVVELLLIVGIAVIVVFIILAMLLPILEMDFNV